MHQHRITIDDADAGYDCREDESLLAGMHRLGRRGIPVGCRCGGCGVCKVRIVEGRYATAVMSRAHVSASEEAAGCVLACRVFPASDLRLRVLGKMQRYLHAPGAAARNDTVSFKQ